MSSSSRRIFTALLLAALSAWLLGTRPARAQAQPLPSAEPASPASEQAEGDERDESAAQDELAEAKRLFRQGNALRAAGDCERAIEYFLKSRALVPSVPNTLNAAVCMAEVGRFDEALELYEDVLTQFPGDVTDDERRAIAAESAQLRGKLGRLDVIANVEGSLVIDGRPRGRLPLLSPVRVLAGTHTVLVMHQGYQSFETTVQVAARETVAVQAQLQPLVNAGSVRIEAPDLEGAQVYIDGAPVGSAPWEGTLEAGEHRYVVRRGDQGSGPQSIVVVQGQTVLARAKTSPLGPELRVVVTPPTAELRLDGVSVGRGRWQGRLPLGEHEIVAREEGYFDERRKLGIDAEARGEVVIELRADEQHPRWGVREEGKVLLEAFGGVAVTPSLRSDAETPATHCPTENGAEKCRLTSHPAALGFAVGGRAVYEFPFHLSVGAMGGYLSVRKELTRQIDGSFIADGDRRIAVLYELDDEIHLSGPFAGASVGYRLPFAELLELRANLAVGALFARTRDAISGTASSGDRTIPVQVQGSDTAVSSVDLFVMPELQLGVRIDGFGVGLGLMAGIFVLDGPALPTGDIVVNDEGCVSGPEVDCAPGQNYIAGEGAYDPFVLWVPSVTAGYAF